MGFDTDDFGLRIQILHVGGDPSNKPAPADGHKYGIQWLAVLINDFHANGALARNHIDVVIRGYVDQALRFAKCLGVLGCLVVIIAVQYNLCSAVTHRVHLDAGCVLTHYDSGANTEFLCGNGYALRMVSSGCGDDPNRFLIIAELRHFVVGTAQLETVNRLHVLTLQSDVKSQAHTQQRRIRQWALDRKVIHF